MSRAIKILGLEYEIVEKESIEYGEPLFGQIRHIDQKIYILKNLTEERKQIVLLHEVLHSIFQQLGFDKQHDDEHLIQSLATGIYQVIKENENLLKVGEKE